jgi:hypothetical protein
MRRDRSTRPLQARIVPLTCTFPFSGERPAAAAGTYRAQRAPHNQQTRNLACAHIVAAAAGDAPMTTGEPYNLSKPP